jgi:DNA-binding MarR family transcriptional regulator
MKRAFKGIWIPSEIYLNEELSLQEIFLLAEIDSLDGGEGCFANNGHFEKRLRLSEKSIRDYIKSLKSKGYVEVEQNKRNNTRKIFSLLKLRVAEKTFGEISPNLRQDLAQPPAKSRHHTYIEKTIENTSLEKNTKKETPGDQTVELNEMVETESKIPIESEKEFESMWKYFFGEYKKEGKALGSKSEANKNFLKKLKTRELEEIKQAIYNYFHDCKIRGYGFMHLASFLSTSKKYVDEWKNGSENHQALLELKNKPQKRQNKGSRFESKTERVERNVREQREGITRVLDGLPDDLFAPEPSQKLIN